MMINSSILFPSGGLFNGDSRRNFFNEIAHEGFFNQLFKEEYQRLDEQCQTYLDHATASVFPKSVIQKHFELLNNATFSTPTTVSASSGLLDLTRKEILSHFKAHDYWCVFTNSASTSMDIVGEHHLMDRLLMLADNHTSYNRLSQLCELKKGKSSYALLKEDLTIDEPALTAKLKQMSDGGDLFILPAQSFVSGVKHDLSWIQEAQNSGWDVLLDADAHVANSGLNLSVVKPDFVTFSFNKMFGYPAGLACLLIRKDSISRLMAEGKAGSQTHIDIRHQLLPDHSRFESSTIDYLSIPAIKFGIDFHKEIGVTRIESRVESMRSYLFRNMRKLKHSSGQQLIEVFGPRDKTATGSALLFTVRDSLGRKIPSNEVIQQAKKRSISLDAGSYMSRGITEVIQSGDLESSEEGYMSYNSTVRQFNMLRGAVRVSVGISTRKRDLDTFIDFLNGFKDRVN